MADQDATLFPFPQLTFARGTEPAAADADEVIAYVDDADGHLKTIDESGTVTDLASGAPSAGDITFVGAKAYHSTTQAVSAGASVACSLNSEEFDTSGFHDNSTNNSRLTVPVTGYYVFEGHMRISPDTASNPETAAWLRRDGTTALRGSAFDFNVPPPGTQDMPGSELGTPPTTVHLTAGQYVELMVYSANAVTIGSANAESSTSLTARLVGV